MATRSKADTRGWDEVLKRVRAMKGYTLKAGIVDDRPHAGSDLTVAELGAVHEFGAPSVGIEARPWLGYTMQAKRRELAAMTERSTRAILNGASTAVAELSRMGTFIATSAKAAIRQRLIRQELAASTIKRRQAKGQSDPAALLVTEQLVDAIGFKIDRGR